MSLAEELRTRLKESLKGQLNYDRNFWEDGRLHEFLNGTLLNSCYVSLPLSCAATNSNFASLTKLKDKPRLEAPDTLTPPPKVPSTESAIQDYLAQRDKETDLQINDYEHRRRQKVQDVFNKKREEFNKHSVEQYQKSVQRLHTFLGRRKMEEDQKTRDLEAKHEISINEGKKRHQQLVEHNLTLAKQSDERFQQAALKDKQEQEADQRRILEMQQRIEAFARSRQSIYDSFKEAADLLQSCSSVPALPQEARLAVEEINKIVNTVRDTIDQLKVRSIEQKDVVTIASLQEKVASHLATFQSAVELVNKQFNESKKAAVETVDSSLTERSAVPAPSEDVVHNDAQVKITTGSRERVMPSEALQHYAHYISVLEEVSKACQDLAKNPANKKCRNDFQKAVNTPVNAISVQSGSQLLDQLARLQRLISGQTVNVSERRISINDHPQGRLFCLDLLAKKFVKQGEEVVSSSHLAAFPIAVVIVGLWKNALAFGELLVGHFFNKCVFLVPYHPMPHKGQSEEEYYQTLGYNVIDGVLEEKDKFLKRMSGVVRLYAAILQSEMPPGCAPPHPYGMEHGWAWFSSLLNQEPVPDVTATVLFDFLDVCGYALMRHYGRQFQKLLRLLWQDYFPKMKKMTPAGPGGPVACLEHFLQKCARYGSIPPPFKEHFWDPIPETPASSGRTPVGSQSAAMIIQGEKNKAAKIFDFLYLGSEKNASNLEELQNIGVGHILNVTREIDNFFPGMFDYMNIRVYDDEGTDLMRYWGSTYKFIEGARHKGSKVLVHCRMGVSRSASVVSDACAAASRSWFA